MDLKEYMSGAPLPPDPKAKPEKPKKARIYGLARGRKGELRRFVVLSRENVPETAVVVREEVCDGQQVQALVDALYKEFSEGAVQPDPIPWAPSPGEVVHYCDGDGTHTAVVLESGPVLSFVLFLTTNPLWNPMARPITRDELALTGWGMRHGRQTYFAPVVRATAHMVRTGNSFPHHRVDALLKEFDREACSRY